MKTSARYILDGLMMRDELWMELDKAFNEALTLLPKLSSMFHQSLQTDCKFIHFSLEIMNALKH